MGAPVVPSWRSPSVSTPRLWGEAAGEGALPHFLLDTVSFPRRLRVVFCFPRHLSLRFGGENPPFSPPASRTEAAPGPHAGRGARRAGSLPLSIFVDSFQRQLCIHIY